MLIRTIWVQSAHDDPPWLKDAWDEDSLQENWEGWNIALKKAKNQGDARVLIVEIQNEAIDDLFKSARVPGRVVEVRDA